MHIKTYFLTCYSCLYYLQFHGIPSSFILSVIKNRGWGGFLLDRQNLLSVTEVIFWWSQSNFFFCPLSNFDILFNDGPDKHSQKSTLYLCQNNVVLYFEPHWKQDNADIKFWYFIKLKLLTFPMEEEHNFATDQVKSYGLKKRTRDCRWQWDMDDTP